MLENKNRKLAIYLYSDDKLPLLEVLCDKNKLKIGKLISPQIWQVDDKVAEIKLNTGVVSDFSKGIRECNLVVILNQQIPDEYREVVLSNIVLALKNNKIVYCYLPLTEEERIKLYNITKEFGGTFVYKGRDYSTIVASAPLEKIRTPIIYILNLIEENQNDNFDVSLVNALEHEGYKIKYFNNSPDIELAGYNTLPELYYNETPNALLHSWNQFLKTCEEQQNLDLIIVSIPNGAIKFSEKVPGGCGIFPFILSQSVLPDYVILKVPYNNAPSDYYKEIYNSILGMLNVDIDAIVMSDDELYAEDYVNLGRLGFKKRTETKVCEYVEEFLGKNIDCSCCAYYKDIEKIKENIIERLGEYGEIEIL